MRISMLGAIPFAIGFTIIVCAVEGKPKRNETKTVNTSYTKPIVADSVLNDWANDPKISPEKRVVLNEMVKEMRGFNEFIKEIMKDHPPIVVCFADGKDQRIKSTRIKPPKRISKKRLRLNYLHEQK